MTKSKHSFLQDIWYYALPGKQLKPGQLVTKTLLNEPILFGRTRTGEVFALRDICPHRAVPLSYGRFDGQTVACCYHGWQFDPTGRCLAIPSLTDEQKLDLECIRVKSYQVQEVQGNVWIYIPSSHRASSPQMSVPWVPGFGDCSSQAGVTMRFPGHIDHVVCSILDPSHVAFIHRSWWWRSAPSQASVSIGRAFAPSPYGFTRCRHVLLQQQNFFYRLMGSVPEVEFAFQLPGVRIEQVTTKHHTACNLTVATPITETETEVTTLFYTTLPWFTSLKPILLPFIRAFLNQDREVAVKQQIGLKYNPPLLLIKDADTLAKWYYQLKAEFASALAEGRPFVNPVKEQVLNWRS